jgi:hypothetical protein
MDPPRLLIEALRERSQELAYRSIDEMYRADPFWIDRFGERGKKFAREDGVHHVDYLVTALSTQSKSVLSEYARWLQAVLVVRGMCTEHLRENFERLARIIREAGLPQAETAADYLRAAEEALRYPEGPGREIQDAAPRLIASVPAPSAQAARMLASYLADAAHAGDPSLFAKQVAWLRANGRADTNATLRAFAAAGLPAAGRECLQVALR